MHKLAGCLSWLRLSCWSSQRHSAARSASTPCAAALSIPPCQGHLASLLSSWLLHSFQQGIPLGQVLIDRRDTIPGLEGALVHAQAVFDSCRTLDLRNATVSLGCADLLRGAPSLECLRLRSDFFTADKGAPSKHEEMRKFMALLPV